MKLLIQRVNHAQVTVKNQIVGQIGQGLLVFVSFAKLDSKQHLQKAVHKLIHLRMFEDSQSKFNLSLQDVHGQILVVSQFTLHATLKGHRPSFSQAADPITAKQLYLDFISELKQSNIPIQTGQFGAHMQVKLQNDGPVTIHLEI